MSSESAQKKDIQKLQRAIVDGLEDVKAQDIQVFSTEHLSPLFERVVVASGTSNRQTKALAASVRDAVRDAGFAKPRVEGEDNGEWIIVDCGQAVVHIMQPAIRQYYHLEDLWGEKPVRLKLGAAKPFAAPREPVGEAAEPVRGGSLRRSSAARRGADALPARAQAGEAALSTPKAKKPAARKASPTRAGSKPVGSKPAGAKPAGAKPAGKAPAKVVKVNAPKPAAKKSASKPAAKPAAKSATKPATKKPASKPAGKSAPKSAAGRKPAARKA